MTPQEKEKLKNSLKNHTSPYDGNDGMISTIIAQMLVDDMPEPKKVKVPKWFAEWVEGQHDNKNIILRRLANYYAIDVGNFTREQNKWIVDNYDTATRAILDGYETFEPVYIMAVPYAGEPLYYCKTNKGNIRVYAFTKENAQRFTNTEIDEYFPKIKEFAEEVTS